MTHWLKPPLVESPSPLDRNSIIKFRISEEYFEKNIFIRRRTPILQLWAHVIGVPPPINNISRILQVRSLQRFVLFVTPWHASAV
jgi:hypothetical protein